MYKQDYFSPKGMLFADIYDEEFVNMNKQKA